jgi:hypothetical protein
MQKFIAAWLIVSSLVLGGYIFHASKQLNHRVDLIEKYNPIGSTDTTTFKEVSISTSKLVTTGSTLVSATNTARTIFRMTNTSSNNIYCKFRSTAPQAAVLYEGVAIMASSTFEMPTNGNIYTGPIYCISTGNASTTVAEG